MNAKFRHFFLTVVLIFLIPCFSSCKSEKQKDLELLDQLSNNSRYDDVIKQSTNFIDKYPNEPEIFYKRGWALFASGFTKLAEKDFEKCIIINPEYANGYKGMAAIYANNGNYDLSENYYNKAFDLAKSNDRKANILGSLAIIYYTQKKYDKAVEYYDKAISLKDDGSFYLNKARTLLAQGKATESGKLLETAINSKPFEENRFKHMTYFQLSAYYAAIKDYNKSFESITKALEMSPSNKEYVEFYKFIKAKTNEKI